MTEMSKLENELLALRKDANDASSVLGEAAFHLAEGVPIDPIALAKTALIGERIAGLRNEFKIHADTCSIAVGPNFERCTFSELGELLERLKQAAENNWHTTRDRLLLLQQVEVDLSNSPPDLVEIAQNIKREIATMLEEGKDSESNDLPSSWRDFYSGDHQLAALLSYLQGKDSEDFEQVGNLEERIERYYGQRFRRWVSLGKLHLPRSTFPASEASNPRNDEARGKSSESASSAVGSMYGSNLSALEPIRADQEDSYLEDNPANLEGQDAPGRITLRTTGTNLESYATKLADDAEQRQAMKLLPVPPASTSFLESEVALGARVLGMESPILQESVEILLRAQQHPIPDDVLRRSCLDFWKEGHPGLSWIIGTGMEGAASITRYLIPRLLRIATLTNPPNVATEERARLISEDCQWLLDNYQEFGKLAGFEYWALSIALKPAIFSCDPAAQGLLWWLQKHESVQRPIRETAKLFAEFAAAGEKLDLAQVAVARNVGNRDALLNALREKADAFIGEAEIRERKTFSAVKVWNSLTQNRPTRVGIVYALLEPVRTGSRNTKPLVKALQRVEDSDAIGYEIGLAEADVSEADRYPIQIKRGTPAYKGLVRDVEETRQIARQWLELCSTTSTAQQESISRLASGFEATYHRLQPQLLQNSEHPEASLGIALATSTLASVAKVLQIALTDDAPDDAVIGDFESDLCVIPGIRHDAWTRYASTHEAMVVLNTLKESPTLRECVVSLAAADEFDKLDALVSQLRLTDAASADLIESYASATITQRWRSLSQEVISTSVKLDVSMENALTQMEEASRLKSELESIRNQIPPQFSGLSADSEYGPEVNRPDPGLFQAARITLREINDTLLSDLNRFTDEAIHSITLPDSVSEPVRAAFNRLIKLGEFNKALLLREIIEVGAGSYLALDATTLRAFFTTLVKSAERLNDKWPIEVSDLQFLGLLGDDDANAVALAMEQLGRWTSVGDAVKGKSLRAESAAALCLRSILEFLGFAVNKQIDFPNAPTPQRVDTEVAFEKTTDRQLCPLPSFGSLSGGRLRLILVAHKKDPVELSSLIGQSALPTLVLYFYPITQEDRLRLAEACRNSQRTFLLIDNSLFAFLITTKATRLRALFECSVPFSYAQPFVSSGGSVPPEMFFGRESQKNGLISMSAPYLVYGGRQLGKTVLLREVERLFNTEKGHCAIWMDLSNYGLGYSQPIEYLWVILNRELQKRGILQPKAGDAPDDPDPDGLCTEIELWLQTPGRRLLLLLDEADAVLEEDARERLMATGMPERYSLTTRLSGLQSRTNNSFKVVFSGLRNVLRFAYDNNHPIGKLGRPLSIGPFTSISNRWNDQRKELLAAQSLIVEPLRCLGITFESETVLHSVLWATNFYPSLEQIVGESIVQYCARDSRSQRPIVLGEEDVKRILVSRDVRAEFEHRLRLTLGLDGRYAVIVYCIAKLTYDAPEQHSFSGFSSEAIQRVAKEYAPALFESGVFVQLLSDMVEMGMLRKTGDLYDLRSPMFFQMLGSYADIAKQLSKEWEVAPEYNPATYRSPLPISSGQIELSPFTDAQLQRIVGPIRADTGSRQSSRVSICFGCDASGLDRVEFCLDAYLSRKSLWTCGPEVRFFEDWKRELSNPLRNRNKSRTFVVLVGSQSGWDNKWLRAALERQYEYPVHFVFLADPKKAFELDLFQSGVEPISLGPWHDTVLRRWLHENKHDESPSARRCFREQASLWPGILNRFRSFIATSSATLDQNLHDFHELWASSPWEFLRMFGITNDQTFVLSSLNLLLAGAASLEELSLFGRKTDHERAMRWSERLGIVTKEGDKYSLDAFVAHLMSATGWKDES